MPSRAGRCRTRSSPRPVRRSTANTVRGAGAVEGDQQTLPSIANNISTSRRGQGQAPCQAGARPVHPCAPPRCSMVLERPRPTSGRGATASLCCVALYVSWIHLVPHTRGFAALKEAFEGPKPAKPNNRVHTSRGTTPRVCRSCHTIDGSLLSPGGVLRTPGPLRNRGY